MSVSNTTGDVIVAIDSDDDEPAPNKNTEKPIIQLFRLLIYSDDKQNTVLANSQIVEILSKEFDIYISRLHELEGDIYLTIIKKCLKDWPQWDEFDRTVRKLKKKQDKARLDAFLQTKYLHLKEHLKNTIDCAQATVKKVVEQVIEHGKSQTQSKKDTNRTVALEIYASRNQLNQLFFRFPAYNNNIFNSSYSLPTQIHLKTLSLESILNWWDVGISILGFTNIVFYRRETKHELKHVLVNKILLSQIKPSKVLDQDVKTNATNHYTTITQAELLSGIDALYSEFKSCSELLDFIKKDISLLPNQVYARAAYQRYTNKYPYVRYLYKEVDKVDINLKRYDLQLEETVSPKYETYVGPIQNSCKSLDVRCIACNVNFNGISSNLVYDLKAHFEEHHTMEPDWKCINCNKKFPMATLAENWWSHRC